MAFPITGWRRLAWLWTPAVALAVAIFVESSRPSIALPGRSDLLAHAAAFGALAALVLRACAGGRWRGVSRRSAASAWLLTIAYGATDELHQRFVPGRTPALDDWIADATGAALAVAAIVVAARALAARRPKSREV